MKLITPPLVVEENDAFLKDALGRKGYGEKLLNLVVKSDDALVISLDAKWGEGKTTFVKMWQGLLAERNVPNVYIDAFASDFIDDPFISVVSAITDYANDNINKGDEKSIEKLKGMAKEVGAQALSLSARVGIKAITVGIVSDSDIADAGKIRDELFKDPSNAVGSFVEGRIDAHSKDMKLIQSFRKTLSELPSKLQDGDNNPLVVIIDELDRCKPTYAVDMIEKIKHLFSVENVVFLLVMNKEQLENSIKRVYGKDIDSHAYLQKFISIETKLPKRLDERRTNDLKTYTEKLVQLHGMQTWKEWRALSDCVAVLARRFDLSLRQLEKVFTNLMIFRGISNNANIEHVFIVAFLVIIKVIRPRLFEDLLHHRVNYGEVIEELNLADIDNENTRHREFDNLILWLKYALLTKSDFSTWYAEDGNQQRLSDEIMPWDIDRERLIPMYAEQFSMFEIG